MQNTALQYNPEDLLILVIQERLDAVEEQARRLQAHTGSLSRAVLELQTLASLSSALSGFLGEIASELDLSAWVPLEERTRDVVTEALSATRQVIGKARSRGARPSTLANVLAAAEAVRVLREDVILAALRAR